MKTWIPTVKLLTLFVFWRIWLLLLAALSLQFFPMKIGYLAAAEFAQKLPLLLTVWGNFDGVVFMRVANGGYGVSEVPFFPLLPMLLSALNSIGFSFVIAGLVISTVALLGSLYVLSKLFALDAPKHSFLLLMLVVLSFPTAHYYTAVYQDSLYLLFASSLLLFARRQQWKWAVLAGCLAMLSRLNGIALFFVLGAEYMTVIKPTLAKEWGIVRAWQAFWKALQPQVIAKHLYVFSFLLVPLMFIGYLYFIQWKFGDWHLFFSGVEVWHRDKLVFPLQTFWRYFKILVLYANVNFVYFVAWGEALFTGLYLLVLGYTWNRIRFSYWVFMCLHLLIPVVTGTLQGMPRYGLHLYPLFLTLTLWLAPQSKYVKALYFIVMFLLQAVYLSYFVRGFFVS